MPNFRITRILLKIFEKYGFWSKFRKFRFWWRNTTIFVKFFWTKFSKNTDYGQNSRKFRVWAWFLKNLDFIRNISILIQISENLDFGHNFWEISIRVKRFEISRFWPKFRKIAILFKIFYNLNFGKYLQFDPYFRNSWFWSTFWKNLHFCHNLRKIWILVKFLKDLNWCKSF